MKFGLSDEIIERFSDVFSKYTLVEEIVIYGSRAKNTFREGSDIDLTIKGKNIDHNTFSKIWLELDALNTPYFIDISIFNELTSKSLIEHINRIGKTFYSKQIKEILVN